MKRLVLIVAVVALFSGCMHRWVGRNVTQLEKEYGSPLSVLKQGDHQVYYYPDYLAGRGQMTFNVDDKGIIRSWCATTDVPSVFGDDPFGTGDGGFSSNNPNNPNDNTNPNPPSLGRARVGNAGGRGSGGRGAAAPNC
jgi:hypothetical protein